MRALIETDHPVLSIEKQCEAIGLARSSYYYEPIAETKENMNLMRRIEELHYELPEYGYRKIHAQLRREGFSPNEKKIERLWSNLGFRSILPRPNLSKPGNQVVIYPYLLNGMWIERPNQVFSTDITFIPLPKGYIYLATVTDWFSRFTLSWELSNTLSVDFCLRALEKALGIGIPCYFNTDQGSQFTSAAFVDILKKNQIKISFDGKGRAIDNIYQERSWWSLKYERLYPACCSGVQETFRVVKEYYDHFNHRRPHQALLYATPYEIYHGIPPKHSKGLYKGFKVKEASL
jgi:putative transposase